MSTDYSYTELSITKEDDGHPSKPPETDVLANPKELEAQVPSPPTLNWGALIAPIGTFVAGAALAAGHHAFNAWANGRPVATITVPQSWVTGIGVGFSFAFKTAVGATMGFVLLQCVWFSVLRTPLTIPEIDTIYQIERQAQLYKTLPQALSTGPAIVVFSALTLLLPLSGVFAPGSLTVTTKNLTDVSGPCRIPNGNLGARNTTSFFLSSVTDGSFDVVTPRAVALTTEWFVNQRIPDLPQACGPNCRYKVSVPSFVFQCTPNPSSLPLDQAGVPPQNPDDPTNPMVWNGTIDSTSKWGFYIAWASSYDVGTSGNASCLPVLAQYDVEVQTKNGIQSVTTNVTQLSSPIPDVTNGTFTYTHVSDAQLPLWMQLASLSYAARALFLGSAVFLFTMSTATTQAIQASFLNITVDPRWQIPGYAWGDVLKGVEEFSHNVTAAILTLQLGTMDSECFFDEQIVVYLYTPFALWVPYGGALCIVLVSLVVAVVIMAKNDTGNITTSFSDTVSLTRHLEEDISPEARLRLTAAKGAGAYEYTPE